MEDWVGVVVWLRKMQSFSLFFFNLEVETVIEQCAFAYTSHVDFSHFLTSQFFI
jgi:hypothetical protein